MRNILWAAALFLFSTSTLQAASFVQENDQSNINTPYNTLQVSFSNPTTAGNLIVVYVAPGTSSPGTISVSDSQHNTYSPATSTLTTAIPQCNISQEFFYAFNIVGGSDEITVTTTAEDGMGVVILEYSGIATTSPLDAQAGTSSSSCPYNNDPTSASLTTTNANDVIISGAVLVAGSTWTAGSGYALRTGATIYAVEDQVASSSGAFTGTFGLSASNNWVAAAVSFKAAACGVSGDNSNHIPTDWATFVPPSKGQSYVDATFGCRVTRVTDTSSEDWNGSAYLPIAMGYATVSPFNANDTYLMLEDGWNRHFVTDLTGNFVVSITDMPSANDTWFLWDASDANVFYYTSGNSLMQGTISGSSVNTSTMHQFTEYAAINFMDETDVSQDGAHVVIVGGSAEVDGPGATCGQDTRTGNYVRSGCSGEDVFVYNIMTETIESAPGTYTTMCQDWVSSSNNTCLHKLIQTPDNNVIIQFANDGMGSEDGNRLCDSSNCTYPLQQHIQDTTNHLDTGYDMNGNAVFIEMGNSGVLNGETNPCPSGWGLDVRMIYDMSSAVCLLDNQPSWHVGYRGNAQQPWAVLSFFDGGRAPSPEWFDGTTNYAAPTTSNWQLYEDEIMMVRVDANNNSDHVYRLARAYSRSNVDFYAQPHAAMSRDGEYVAFNSDMAFAHTGCPANFQNTTDCTDVYVIKIK
jgi:hypothetical protein